MYVAVYSTANVLSHVGTASKEVGSSKTDSFEVSLKMQQNIGGSYASEGYKAMVFLWDSETLKPVMNKYNF